MKKYNVSMSCTTINTAYEIETKNKKEAIEIASNQLRGGCESNGHEFYDIEEIETLKSLKHECCDGECHHDDCCGKIPANCKNLNN